MSEPILIPATNRQKPDSWLLLSWRGLQLCFHALEDEKAAHARRVAAGWQLLAEERRHLMAQCATFLEAKRSWERNRRWLLLWSLLMGMAFMGFLIILLLAVLP